MSNAFDMIIWDKGKSHAVDPALIKAVIAAESSFNPRAYRAEPQINDASYGLMQILFNTAKWMGYQGEADGLYQPETNIEFGARFLKYQLNRYNGNVEDAIAAYNTGTVRKRMDGNYVNQPYVDRVLRFLKGFRGDVEAEKNAGMNLRSDLPQLGPVPSSPGGIPLEPVLPGWSIDVSDEAKPWLIALAGLAVLLLFPSRR